MSIFSSLYAGVSGLAANAVDIATISDNIANSSTNGYKRVSTDFHAMVVGDSSSSRYAAGGVRTTTMRHIDQAGPLASTSNATDLAITGRGFLPVTNLAEINGGNNWNTFGMTTTGSFRLDETGYLVSPAGNVLLGFQADTNGAIPAQPRDSTAGLQPVRVLSSQFVAEPTTQIGLAVNLPATVAGTGVVAPLGNEEISVEYFDSLGRSQTIGATYVPSETVANAWQLTLVDNASGATVASYDLVFDTAVGTAGTLDSVTPAAGDPGSTYSAANGEITINLAGVDVEVEIGRPGTSDGMSQLSDRFMPLNITKNGFPPGNVTSIEIDDNGYLNAVSASGAVRTLWQIPIVDVANPNGLRTLGGSIFAPSADSGGFFLWDAATGPVGTVEAYALESSNVDIAEELTSLIQTQRAYSSNAKVIMTVDEMLQETTNLKR